MRKNLGIFNILRMTVVLSAVFFFASLSQSFARYTEGNNTCEECARHPVNWIYNTEGSQSHLISDFENIVAELEKENNSPDLNDEPVRLAFDPNADSRAFHHAANPELFPPMVNYPTPMPESFHPFQPPAWYSPYMNHDWKQVTDFDPSFRTPFWNDRVGFTHPYYYPNQWYGYPYGPFWPRPSRAGAAL